MNKNWQPNQFIVSGWHQPNFGNRTPFTITNHGGPLVNYQVKLTIHQSYTGYPIVVNNGWLNGLCLDNGNDIIFTKSDGTIIHYIIMGISSEYVMSNVFTIYLMIDNLPAGVSNYYIYHNNPTSGSNQSPGTTVFPLGYDHFDGVVLDPSWVQAIGGGGSISVANSLVTLDTGAVNGYAKISKASVAPYIVEHRLKLSNTYDATNKYRMRWMSSAGFDIIGGADDATHTTIQIYWNSWTGIRPVFSPVYMIGTHIFDGTNLSWNLYREDTQQTIWMGLAAQIAPSLYWQVGDPPNTNTGLIQVDWYLVRQYVNPALTPYATFGPISQMQYSMQWFGATNMAYLAAGMQKGDIIGFDGTRCVIIRPNDNGNELMMNGIGLLPSFEPPKQDGYIYP
jgi:hypothetical protein